MNFLTEHFLKLSEIGLFKHLTEEEHQEIQNAYDKLKIDIELEIEKNKLNVTEIRKKNQ